MSISEKKGFFYVGKDYDPKTNKVLDKPLLIDSKDFTTHAVIVGMTGSGKTGLGIDILEEAALNQIPALIIDPKGDMGNLALVFPDLKPADFAPWIDSSDAVKKGLSNEEYAEKTAKTWKEGLASWGEGPERLLKFKNGVEVAIYTPASDSGIPISILSTLNAPPKEIQQDPSLMRDLVISTTSSLLGLVGIEADPLQSKEHILIASILDQTWRDGKNLDLTSLIQSIQQPPFKKVGVIDLDTFLPPKERVNLSMKFNNLIASPGFKTWLEGEKLDIDSLLYTKQGKPRLAILSVAHLNDSERMFFTTLFLNQLLAWMRRQSGTSNLKALLYMDEIFGYFPPSRMPPSKLPMLTLLKQARAYGLGIILATQNPVDLDYKGLANCGMWFVGKLQTERDRNRLQEGLRDAAGSDPKGIEELNNFFSATGNRVFILKSVYLPKLELFQTRWSLSYLRGPLTLPQIDTLTDGENIPKKPASLMENAPTTTSKPPAPIGVPEFFADQNTLLFPFVYGQAKLHYLDTKNKVDLWRTVTYAAPASKNRGGVDWSQAEEVHEELSNQAPEKATFSELPASLLQPKNFSAFSKDFGLWLYQTQSFELQSVPELKLVAGPDETEDVFKRRVDNAIRDKVANESQGVDKNYQTKLNNLKDRLARAQVKADKQKSQVRRQWFSTIVSFISAFFGIIGSLLTGKNIRISQTAINKAGTSINKAGKIGQEQQDVATADSEVNRIEEQIDALEDEHLAAVQKLEDQYKKLEIQSVTIPPRKSDINVEMVGIAWLKR